MSILGLKERRKNSKRQKSVLVLENGDVFFGESFGCVGEFYGELVFNTGMTGYQEIATDPSYKNQIIIFTYPEIGNYGILADDSESMQVHAEALIVHHYNDFYSHPDAISSLSKFLQQHKKAGITGLDTRELTRLVRDQGSQRAIVCTQPNAVSLIKTLQNKLKTLPHPVNGKNLVNSVSTKKSYVWNDLSIKTNRGTPTNSKLAASNKQAKDYAYKIAVYDYGVKYNILRLLEQENCYVQVFPAKTSAVEILNYKPDGILLSNGPGDPTTLTYAVEQVKALLGKVPMFGICFGHQILAQVSNLKIYKLKFGHRGINQPVLNCANKTIEITSQNHGFAVKDENDTIQRSLVVSQKSSKKTSTNNQSQLSHIHLNDKTLSGLSLPKELAFSVQYHPEASPGPHDSQYLFKQFIAMVDKHQKSCIHNQQNKR